MYDENSFIQGVAVGRAMKGVEYDGGSPVEVPDSFDEMVLLSNCIIAENIFCEFETYTMIPYPVTCSFAEE